MAEIPSILGSEKSSIFGLFKGFSYQLFSVRVLLRGLYLSLFKNFSVGPEIGNGFQMPGMFLIDDSDVKKSFQPEYVSEN